MPLNNGETFAGFRIIRLLGSGGMGEVYLAAHPRLTRRDALRVLPGEWPAAPEYRERFRREAELASTLWHPSIVGVHRHGEYDGQLWISTGFVDGQDLGRLLTQRHPDGLPREQVVTIIAAVAGALDYAHNHGLLHRAVNPANIMLTGPDSERVVLVDFGVARNVDDVNAAYAAPEQLLSADFDGRADQYALACTAYQLLTGVQPFADSNPAVVISRQLNSRPPALADTRPEFADLDPVLAKALEKNPADRFASCGGFAYALAAEPTALPAAASTPAQTRIAPVSRSPQRSRRPVVAIAAVCAVIAVIAAIVGVWQLRPSEDAATSGPAGPPPEAPAADHPDVPITSSPGLPTLDGLYRLDYDNPRATLNNTPWPPAGNQVASYWWAFRSTCNPSGCVATSTRMDDINHTVPFLEGGGMTAVFRLVDDSWQGDPGRGSLACAEPYIGQAQAVDTSLTLTPQSGGLAGAQTTTIQSNECALQGAVISVPVQASRVADVPPGNLIADPVTVAAPPAPAPPMPPAPPATLGVP